MKPMILLTTGYYIAPRNGLSQRTLYQNYADCVAESGALPLLELTGGGDADALAARCGGLLLTGGVDVEPARFGEAPHPACGEIDPARDKAELALFSAFVRANKPVLGICRGIQLINTALGGTLWQDLPSQCGIDGHNETEHPVDAAPGSLMASLFGSRFFVNSYHHQAIRQPGRGLAVTADADGVIEAVEHTGLPVWAVQWHPERMRGADRLASGACPDSKPLFDWFVARCAGKSAVKP